MPQPSTNNKDAHPQSLAEDPVGTVGILEGSAFGCDWLLRKWAGLRDLALARRGWTSDATRLALRLLGHRPEAAMPPDDPDAAVILAAAGALHDGDPADSGPAVAAFAALADREIARLQPLRDAGWSAVEVPERGAVLSNARLDTSPSGRLRHRYTQDAERSIGRSLDLLTKFRKAEQAAAELPDRTFGSTRPVDPPAERPAASGAPAEAPPSRNEPKSTARETAVPVRIVNETNELNPDPSPEPISTLRRTEAVADGAQPRPRAPDRRPRPSPTASGRPSSRPSAIGAAMPVPEPESQDPIAGTTLRRASRDGRGPRRDPPSDTGSPGRLAFGRHGWLWRSPRRHGARHVGRGVEDSATATQSSVIRAIRYERADEDGPVRGNGDGLRVREVPVPVFAGATPTRRRQPPESAGGPRAGLAFAEGPIGGRIAAEPSGGRAGSEGNGRDAAMSCAAILSGLLALAAAAPLIQEKGPRDDEQAHDLLRRVGAVYKAMPAYRDEGSVTVTTSYEDIENTQTAAKPFAFARPDRMALAFDAAQFVADGKTWTSLIGDRYLVHKAPGPPVAETLATDPAAIAYFTGAAGMPSMALLRLLTSDDPYTAIMQGVSRLVLEPDRTVGEVKAKSLLIVPEDAPSVRLLIDPKNLLVIRIEVVFRPDDLPPHMIMKEFAWNVGAVDIGVPPAAAFSFDPPEGTEKVDDLVQLTAAPGETGAGGRALLKKPAPDARFVVLDGKGRYASLSKKDLAGKVVLIDFWATWCDPCRKELPAVASLVERYAKGPHADRVRVIAVSLDSALDTGEPTKAPTPADLSRKAKADDEPAPGDGIPESIRELVETTLDAEGAAALNRPPVGRVALDPQGEAAAAFEVVAIPMLVLIGPDGVVRSVHVGAEPDLAATLAAEIDALLGLKARK